MSDRGSSNCVQGPVVTLARIPWWRVSHQLKKRIRMGGNRVVRELSELLARSENPACGPAGCVLVQVKSRS
jgi:hypothetical protein